MWTIFDRTIINVDDSIVLLKIEHDGHNVLIQLDDSNRPVKMVRNNGTMDIMSSYIWAVQLCGFLRGRDTVIVSSVFGYVTIIESRIDCIDVSASLDYKIYIVVYLYYRRCTIDNVPNITLIQYVNAIMRMM